MEYLEFLNLENTTHKKCSKVRSWYLYEQFKSLERNQIAAAQRLKEKSLQEKILLQELCERRERRRFCETGAAGECDVRSDLPDDDPMDLQNIESKDQIFSTDGSVTSEKCESVPSCHYVVPDGSGHSEADSSAESCQKGTPENYSDECCTKVQDLTIKEEDSVSEADFQNLDVCSIARKMITEMETLKEEIDRRTTILKQDVVSNEYVECPNDYCDDIYSVDKGETLSKTGDHDPCAASCCWTKIVSFAYQIMQLTHGNCYYDYSAQILTAILACDVLRRALCKMSDCLQPYICPVKLFEDEVCKKDKSTKLYSKKSKKKAKVIELKNSSSRPRKLSQRYRRRKACSEYLYHDTADNWTDDSKVRRHSEPWKQPSCSTFWRRDYRPFYKSHYRNLSGCCKHTINPMIKLSRFIDKVVSDIVSNSSRDKL